MDTTAIIDVLRWANGQDQLVRLILREGGEVHGTPSSIDLHPTANEVYLMVPGSDDTEIVVSLTAILSAELI